MSPALGAFIGYSTNWLAIKMIFRPLQPKYLFNVRIPFTPGLIPKSKEEISRKIAITITYHLLNPEKLHRLFDSQDFKGSLDKTINDIVDKAFDDVVEDIKNYISQDVIIIQRFIGNLSDRLKAKVKPKITEKLSSHVESGIEKYLREDFIDVLRGLDIENLIYQSLMEVDIQTLEEIILGFSKKQLRYITNLGGVIGFFIGILQLIVMNFTKT